MMTKDPSTVGYLVQIGADIGNSIQLQVSGNLPVGASDAVINSEFDRLVTAFNRQRARQALPDAEENLKRSIVARDNTLRQMELVGAKNDATLKVGKRIPATEQSAYDNLKLNLETHGKEIERFKEHIETLKKAAV